MELKIWAKTFFSVYRILNKLASSIDKFVEIKAYSSFYTSIANLPANNMMKVSEDLTCLINKKITLINIKLLTEKILANIGEEYARFIILRYIENKKFCEISEALHISIRTALRWNNSSLESSAKILRENGFNVDKIKKLVNNEKWLFEVYEKLKVEAVQKHQSQTIYSSILKSATKEYRSFSC